MCDIFRENYKKCFEAFGSRQCKLELDELFKCIYANERYIKHRNYVSAPFLSRGDKTPHM